MRTSKRIICRACRALEIGLGSPPWLWLEPRWPKFAGLVIAIACLSKLRGGLRGVIAGGCPAVGLRDAITSRRASASRAVRWSTNCRRWVWRSAGHAALRRRQQAAPSSRTLLPPPPTSFTVLRQRHLMLQSAWPASFQAGRPAAGESTASRTATWRGRAAALLRAAAWPLCLSALLHHGQLPHACMPVRLPLPAWQPPSGRRRRRRCCLSASTSLAATRERCPLLSATRWLRLLPALAS